MNVNFINQRAYLICHNIIYTSYYTAFGLDFYTEVMDLSYLTEHIPDSPFFRKYKKLNESLIGLVEDYSLVSFIPLNVQVSFHASLCFRGLISIQILFGGRSEDRRNGSRPSEPKSSN